MPHWLIKSALHRAASWLPQRQALNRIFQKWSHSVELQPAEFVRKITETRRQLDILHQNAPTAPAAFTALEVGTGWSPVTPLALYLVGASAIWTYDIEPLVNRPRLLRTAQLFAEFADAGRLDEMLPGWQPERLKVLRKIANDSSEQAPKELFAPLGIHLRVQNAEHTEVQESSIDLITTSAVLMYVPKLSLESIYREFRRTAKAGAVMIHRLNFRDIYSYFDRNITPLNMLRFSSATWRWLDSAVVPQNRLRVSDHRAMHQAAGFRIIAEEHESAPEEMLSRVRLAKEFRGYAKEDILALESWLISLPV